MVLVCSSCSKSHYCEKGSAVEFREFRRNRRKALTRRYYCVKIKGLCKLKECLYYAQCNRAEKKNYLDWKDAFRLNRKQELEQLSKRR